ncbi:MAG: sulfite exporter TauE/SafE family protein [Bacteroides sp.]|nr:sulfite exporter TauE/SafE family protein [Bacteroides sp.]
MALPFIFILTIVASFIQRVSGFGFGIFVMMFFPFFLPSYGESVMLSGLLAGSTALMIAVRNWQYIRWNLMGRVVLFNVAASYMATEYMTSLGNDTMKQCLGVVLILISLYFFFGEGKMGRIFKSKLAQVTVGSVSGVMGGMFAMPGPPLVLYCISAIKDKREYVTTLQAFSVVINLCYTIIRFKAGFYSEDTWLWWLVGLSGAVIGSSVGARCFECISSCTLKYIVYLMMIVSGVMAIV